MDDPTPELGAHVEDAGHLAGQAAGIAGRQPAQGGQAARHRIQGRLVDRQHRPGKRGEGGIGMGRQALAQQRRHVDKPLLQGRWSLASQALVDGIVADGNRRKVPQPRTGHQPPQIALGRRPAQHADDQPGPQQHGRQDRRATAMAADQGRGGEQGAQQLAQQPLQPVDDGQHGAEGRGVGTATGLGQGGDRQHDTLPRPGTTVQPRRTTTAYPELVGTSGGLPRPYSTYTTVCRS